jgi:ribosome recycling factor
MAQDEILMECEEHMEKALSHLLHEFKALRTGRASPGLVEHLQVEYYGSQTSLKSIASISIPENAQILIKPFSPQDIKAIERAINDSKLGLSPHSDGKTIRLNLPPMSQQRRLQMSGQCKEAGEAAKISIRNARRDANKLADNEEKDGTMTEDEAKGCKEAITDLTKSYEHKVEDACTKKTEEIMQV